jgi:hypothetical protein
MPDGWFTECIATIEMVVGPDACRRVSLRRGRAADRASPRILQALALCCSGFRAIVACGDARRSLLARHSSTKLERSALSSNKAGTGEHIVFVAIKNMPKDQRKLPLQSPRPRPNFRDATSPRRNERKVHELVKRNDLPEVAVHIDSNRTAHSVWFQHCTAMATQQLRIRAPSVSRLGAGAAS